MRTLETRNIMRATLALALLAAGCGGDDGGGGVATDDAGVGGEGGGGQITGGQITGGQITGGQITGGQVGGEGGEGGTGGAGGEEPEGLPPGAECELPPFCQGTDDDPEGCCTGGNDDSEACKTGGCRSGNCTTRFSERKGFCTRDCMRDSACENFSDGPFGQTYSCVHNDTDGLCMPGSNQRCDGGANGACTDGEVCTFGQTFSEDATYGGLCQPPRAGGVGVGEACDEDAGIYCANGMCIVGKCSNFCDPNAAESACGSGQACYDDWSLADGQILLDMCLPQPCEKSSDCPETDVCTITLDFSGAPYIVGICTAKTEGKRALGEPCDEDGDDCDGGNICYEGYCTGPCDVDGDCPGGVCSILSLLIDSETMQTAQVQICLPAPAGSGRECTSNDECAAEGDVPAEGCDLVVRGNLENGRPQGELTVGGRCVTPPRNAVAPGEACSAAAPCFTESLCNSGYCSQICRTTADCGPGAYCTNALVSDGGTSSLADDLFAGLCVADAGSHADCTIDADCMAEGEFCRINYLLTGEAGEVERFCSAATGAGMVPAGGDCTGNRDCLSGRCSAWSRVVGDPGYCYGLCNNDADCSEDGSITCERTLVFDGDPGAEDDVTATACVPVHVCASCDFGAGTWPCAGDTVCSRLDFDGGRQGGACLSPCNDGACPDGFACRAAVNADGDELAGQNVCTPVDAVADCRSARPLR